MGGTKLDTLCQPDTLVDAEVEYCWWVRLLLLVCLVPFEAADAGALEVGEFDPCSVFSSAFRRASRIAFRSGN